MPPAKRFSLPALRKSKPKRDEGTESGVGARSNAKAQRVDHGGNYRQIPVALLESDAWNGLSMRARCIALALLRRFSGFNNGSIAASARDLADAVGSHRYAANRAALGELISAGIITIERMHPRGSRMATEYRLTFIESGDEHHRRSATNDWRSVESGNKRKNSTPETSTQNGKRVDAVSNDRKRRVGDASTDATETSHFRGNAPADDASTLIVSHSAAVVSRVCAPSKTPQNAGGPFRAPSCALPLDELRAFAQGYLASAGPGGQTRLATAAGVPGGSLSKFLAGKGLAAEHHVRLQIAVGRAWSPEKRPAAVTLRSPGAQCANGAAG
jgi:hypothetical protein